MSSRYIEQEKDPVMEIFTDVLGEEMDERLGTGGTRVALKMLNRVYDGELGAIVVFCGCYGIDLDAIVDIVKRRIDMGKEGL